MTTRIPHIQYLFTDTPIHSWSFQHVFCCIPHLSGGSKNKHFFCNYKDPIFCLRQNMQITVIAISSLWIFVSSFHPLQKLFITQIKWSKGFLFAHELWLDVQMQILQSFIHTNVKQLNRTGLHMYAEVWRRHRHIHEYKKYLTETDQTQQQTSANTRLNSTK